MSHVEVVRMLEDIKGTNEIDIKTRVSEMKTTLEGLMVYLTLQKKTLVKLEDMIIIIILNERHT